MKQSQAIFAKNEAPSTLRSGYLLPAPRRERNPSEAKSSSLSSAGLRPGYFAKGDKSFFLSYRNWLRFLLVIALLTGLTIFLGKNTPDSDKTPVTHQITNGSCTKDSGCTIGIRVSACCSCPQAVNKQIIGKEDWEVYEKGKDYSSRKDELCSKIVCEPCQYPNMPICQNGACQFTQQE